jgi:lysophospholipase L1-like esterase
MRRRRIFQIGIALAALVVAGLIALEIFSEPPESAPLDPYPDSSLRIVALGDSYISGEGARRYFLGTDQPRENSCHRAATAYPYRIAMRLKASLVFVACSGAETIEVTTRAQHPRSGEEHYGEVYGARPQVEVLEEIEDPDVVLISIGGNDAGFREIGEKCALPARPHCRPLWPGWLQRLESTVYPRLVETYTAVREAAPEAEVFAINYPNAFDAEFCDDLGDLNEEEMAFIRDVFVGELNETVIRAARAAGIHSIDITDALAGRRFCEVPLRQTAINFIAASRTHGTPIDLTKLTSLIYGSLHPNPLGHEMIEKKILARLDLEEAD